MVYKVDGAKPDTHTKDKMKGTNNNDFESKPITKTIRCNDSVNGQDY